MFPLYLPIEDSIFSVQTEQPVKKAGLVDRMWCRHIDKTEFTLIDHRGGPWWMSETHKGTVCTSCGKILSSKRIY